MAVEVDERVLYTQMVNAELRDYQRLSGKEIKYVEKSHKYAEGTDAYVPKAPVIIQSEKVTVTSPAEEDIPAVAAPAVEPEPITHPLPTPLEELQEVQTLPQVDPSDDPSRLRYSNPAHQTINFIAFAPAVAGGSDLPFDIDHGSDVEHLPDTYLGLRGRRTLQHSNLYCPPVTTNIIIDNPNNAKKLALIDEYYIDNTNKLRHPLSIEEEFKGSDRFLAAMDKFNGRRLPALCAILTPEGYETELLKFLSLMTISIHDQLPDLEEKFSKKQKKFRHLHTQQYNDAFKVSARRVLLDEGTDRKVIWNDRRVQLKEALTATTIRLTEEQFDWLDYLFKSVNQEMLIRIAHDPNKLDEILGESQKMDRRKLSALIPLGLLAGLTLGALTAGAVTGVDHLKNNPPQFRLPGLPALSVPALPSTPTSPSGSPIAQSSPGSSANPGETVVTYAGHQEKVNNYQFINPDGFADPNNPFESSPHGLSQGIYAIQILGLDNFSPNSNQLIYDPAIGKAVPMKDYFMKRYDEEVTYAPTPQKQKAQQEIAAIERFEVSQNSDKIDPKTGLFRHRDSSGNFNNFKVLTDSKKYLADLDI